nr:zinc knuckle CX2CX4HX4C [Tanacetum cinerariifolium]
MLRVFPITLTGAAKRWFERIPSGKINTWDLLKNAFIQSYCPSSKIAKLLKEIHNFKHSSSDGIVAITSTHDSLGRDMKKLKENLHDIQVGCGIYERDHLGKDCPLNKEVKRVEKPSLGELMNKHLEESTRRRNEKEKWMKKLQETTDMNIRNQNAALKNLETQVEQLTKNFQAKTAKEAPSSYASIGHCKAIFSDNDAPSDVTSSNETNELHRVSFISHDNVHVFKRRRRSTDSQMHNNIMAAGSRDRPPMLAPGRYPQWRSRFLRYVDTRPNGEALRKCILIGPYKPTTVLVHVVEVTDNSPAVAEHTTIETPSNMSPENKAYFLAEKEAIHLILTGIGDDIYLTVDACQIS